MTTEKNILGFSIHPLALMIPRPNEKDFKRLCEDIKKNGVIEPIIMYDGLIIDGVSRLMACEAMGKTPPMPVIYSGKQSLVDYIISKNMVRRHLTTTQKVKLATEIIPEMRKEAKKRQAHGQTAPGKTLKPNVAEALVKSGEVVELAAKKVGVGKTSVKTYLEIQKKAPDLIEKVNKEELSIGKAKKIMDDRKRIEEKMPAPENMIKEIENDIDLVLIQFVEAIRAFRRLTEKYHHNKDFKTCALKIVKTMRKKSKEMQEYLKSEK